MVHVTRPQTFQGCFIILGLELATIKLLTIFEISISVHYEDKTELFKMWKMGWFEVVKGHPRSLKTAPFDRAHKSSY